jgi:hypothetical protein
MVKSDGLGDDQVENECPAVHACAQPDPATCWGQMKFLMNAIKHLFILRPPKADLQERAGTLPVWLKLIPTLYAVISTRFIGRWQGHVVNEANKE